MDLRPRNYRSMDGDGTRKARGGGYEVRCIVELDDDETFCPKKNSTKPETYSECPYMKARLARHFQEFHHHSKRCGSSQLGATCNTDCQTLQLNINASKQVKEQEVLTEFFGNSIALSPSISMDDTLCNISCQSSKTPSIDLPTTCNHSPRKLIELYTRDKCNTNTRETKNEGVRQSATVILLPRGHYKDNLRTVIVQWLLEIPVFPNIDQASKIIRENAVRELNQAIYNLSTDINNANYEENVKTNIHNFIEGLPIWFPCSASDQDSFKGELECNLFERIMRLNKDSFSTNIDKTTYVRNSHRKTNTTDTELDPKIVRIVLRFLSKLKFIETDDWGYTINIHKVKDEVLNRLKPVIRIMSHIGNNTLFLKTELITILKDIPLDWPHNEKEQLNNHAQELADLILAVRENKNHKENKMSSHSICTRYSEDSVNYKLTEDIIKLINTVIDTKNSGHKEELVNTIIDSFDSIRSGNDSYAIDEIFEFLNSNYDITEESASFLTNTIVEKMKHAAKSALDKSCSPVFLCKESLLNNVLCFVSDHDMSTAGPSNYPITSTPKSSTKKEMPKLNAEEKKYIDDLSKVIFAWVDTVPELAHVNDDKNYKEIIVFDLAGQLTDEMKLDQYGPDKNYLGSKENLIKCTVMRWIIKFEEEAYQNMNEDVMRRYLDSFYSQFSQIPVPVLTKPQHGTRQYENVLKITRKGPVPTSHIEPKIIDVIEDEISIWMNEQPSDIYSISNREERNKMLHEFALKIQDQLQNKRSTEDIKRETKVWLDKILKSNKKKNIDHLSEMLKERIIKVPINYNLGDKQEDENRGNKPNQDFVSDKNTEYELNKTLIKLVDKFIKHNFEEADSLVKGAYTELLKCYFRKLSPEGKVELYENCCEMNSGAKVAFSEKLDRELHYVRDISDWLNNLPIDSAFNVPGNSNRIDFIIDLAKEICHIEMLRVQEPEAADFDDYLTMRVSHFHFPKLPILPSKKSESQMVSALINKVIQSRHILNQPAVNKNQSLDGSCGIGEQNLGEFIDEYIRVNGREIANDPMKLEAWTARLLKEINRMAQTTEPTSSFKMKAYDKLANIQIPGDESVIEFNRKLMYAHEIGDWIMNMPLQAISDQEGKDMLAKMISDLAEELSEKHADNIQNDPELVDFVMKWISTLPLEPSKVIDVTVLIQQLNNRIKRVNEGKNQSLNDSSNENKANVAPPINKDTKRLNNSNINIGVSILRPISNKAKLNNSNTKKLNSSSGRNKVGCSGELVVNAIEDWCDKLPIKEQDKESEKIVKNSIAIKLFQKVGDLNLDPGFYDDFLYQDVLGDEIDKIIKELHYDEIQKDKEGLKSSLLNNIMEARAVIKEQTAGEQYRHRLENAIEASIPVPINNKKTYDPGFELYKNKLTNMFILENFDHADDAVKLKHEIRIKDEIDKYFQEAQKKNAVPLSRDEIYNELYSALFKVPVPNENSVIQDVEEVKLRCEIDGWFEKLPIREATDLNELLDWDKILEMLAKRIYEIESNEPQSEEKIHKEISKWLVKFPLLPGNEQNIDKYAKDLEERLKATKEERKCVPKSNIDKAAQKGKTLKKVSRNSNMFLNRSQVPGPSGTGLNEASPRPCCIAASTPRKKTADIILEMVEHWCQNLPLYAKPGQNVDMRTVRDNLMTSILRKLSELNSNPRIFEDDMLYDEYLKDELERLIATLPMCCELQKSKEKKKAQLSYALRSIKPLIRDERARHEYKKDVKTTITNMLPEPLNATAEKAALYKELVDGIADSFVLHNYNRDDYEGKQIYKNQIREAIMKFFTEIRDDNNNEDPLIKQNRLLCELAKIPIPSEEAIKDDVEEIKMKEEVSNFLDEVIPDEKRDIDTEIKVVKSNLSKRLHDLEKSGHSCTNDKTMKEEVARSLKKINVEVDEFRVEDFIKKLKFNEQIRKTPPVRKPEGNLSSVNVSQQLKHHGYISGYADSTDNSMVQNYEPVLAPPVFYTTQPSSSGGVAQPYIPFPNQASESEKFYTLYSDGHIASPKQPQHQGYPQYNVPVQAPQGNYYQHPVSPNSVQHYTLPPGSPPPSEMFGSNVIYYQSPGKSPDSHHTMPTPSSPPPRDTRLQRSFNQSPGKSPVSYHTLPPGSPPPPEMFGSNVIYHQSPGTSPVSHHTMPSSSPPEMFHTSGQRSFPQMQPTSGLASTRLPQFDNRFPPRQQTRRQSLNFPSTPSAYLKRRTSLQAPLKYDYGLHDNRNDQPSYRDVCAEPVENINQHMPLRVLDFTDKSVASESHSMPQYLTPVRQITPGQNQPPSPQISRPPPMQYQPAQPTTISEHSPIPRSPVLGSLPQNTAIQGQSSIAQTRSPNALSTSRRILPPGLPTPQAMSPVQGALHPSMQARTSAIQSHSIPSQPTMATQPTQSYQGFQNAVAAGSSPLQPTRTSITPEEILNNQLPPDISNQHRMAATPRTLRDPPKKKRRSEEVCECLGERRCRSFSEEWGSFPFWCFMPYRFPRFCYF